MSLVIAWQIIGSIFFFGIAMDHQKWTKSDALMAVPCLIVVAQFWPVGLIYRARYEYRMKRIDAMLAAAQEVE
jgi:hypothetical protein